MSRHVLNAPRPSLPFRVLRGLALLAVIATLAWYVVEGWSIATWIGEDYLVGSSPAAVIVDDAAVIGVDTDRVTLRRAPMADEDISIPGLLGFAGDGFYLRLGEVVAVGSEDVTRTFETVEGTSPPVGAFGDIDPLAHPPSALEAAGLYEVTYPGPLGAMDALAVDGGSTWVIHVHDRLGGRWNPSPVMMALATAGPTQRSISYRNDPGQPADAGGTFTFGLGEREDLAAAIDDARRSGADKIILAGYGTGASVVMAQAYRDLDVAGVILDSPTIDSSRTVSKAVARSHEGLLGITAPSATWLGTMIASLRYDLDWQTSDYLSRADQLAVPVLVVHGNDDEEHPIEASRELAAARPDMVRLVEIDGGSGGLTWNADPGTYEMAVLEFVDGLRSR